MSKHHDLDKPHSIEEKLNAMTHSIGTGMSIVGLIFLIILSTINQAKPINYVSFALYGTFQILLYLTSSLTHMFTDMPKFNKVFRVMDQISVYMLIAGTYTPVALIAMRGPWGWSVFGIVWGLAIIGILSKLVIFKGKNLFSDLLYLPMGWLIAILYKPFSTLAPEGFVMWVMLGGGLYSLGIIFYLLKKVPMSHVIWHLFVVAGSVCFYIGFAKYLV